MPDVHTTPHHPTIADRLRAQALWTVPEASPILGMSAQTLYRAIRADEIAVVKIGERVRIPAREMLRLIGEPA